jgi:dTDP-glucose 4,6-dehydratase
VAGSVVHELDQFLRFPDAVENRLRHLEVRLLGVGPDAEKTNLEVTEAILDSVGASEELIEFVDDRAGHDQRYAMETDKIEELGWEPTYSFEEGLQRTIEYYLE